MAATDILGKIGEKVGSEFNSFRVSIGNTYATQAAVNTLSQSVGTNTSNIGTLTTKTGSLSADGNSANFTGDLSAQNLTLNGDLTVNGTTTSLNTQTLEVEDNIIEVNLTSIDGSETAQTGGIQVNRGKVAETVGTFVGQNNSGSGESIRYYEIVASGPYAEATASQLNLGESSNSVSYDASAKRITFNVTSAISTINDFKSYLEGLGNFQVNLLTSHDTLTVFAEGTDLLIGGGGSFTPSTSDVFAPKSKFIWDDAVSKFRVLLGNAKANLDTGDIDANELKVPSGTNIKINNVELGNYSSFETEFLANL